MGVLLTTTIIPPDSVIRKAEKVCMVYHRINEHEANLIKHINFVTALPAPEIPPPYSAEDARQLLRALAAQVRPIMKSHGFAVNSFEEVGSSL